MKEAQFREWLMHDSKSGGMSPGSVSSRISNCRRLENAGYNLDEEFDKDGLVGLIALLEYTPHQEPKVDIRIDGDMKSGLATLRSAANLYRRFRKASSLPRNLTNPAPAFSRLKEDRLSSNVVEVKSHEPISNEPRISQVKTYTETCDPYVQAYVQTEVRDSFSNNNLDVEAISLWFDYMKVLESLTAKLGRSSNVVGEFAERLVADVYGGDLFTASAASADVVLPDGRLIQVKSRVPRQGSATSLGVIRSWDFDLLVVVMFSPDGNIQKAVELDAADARRLSVPNSHQNGWVISTTDKFYSDSAVRDVTGMFRRKLQHEA